MILILPLDCTSLLFVVFEGSTVLPATANKLSACTGMDPLNDFSSFLLFPFLAPPCLFFYRYVS
jgi:hypothetical protein